MKGRGKKLKPCPYCGTDSTPKGNQIRLENLACICGEVHTVCKVKCAKELQIATGAFPDYKVVLRRCPPKVSV